MSSDLNDPKNVLHRYLQSARESLLWKLDGLSEREARWPRTPTGTNLLGLVKHAAGIEIGYFGDTFGRPWPDPDEVAWMHEYDTDPHGDLYAQPDESLDGIVALYRRVWEFADETIATLPLEAPGRVPWWRDGGVTLQRIIVHVTQDLSRHAGHADILRELHDNTTGLTQGNTNLPDWDDAGWESYAVKLRSIAERFPA